MAVEEVICEMTTGECENEAFIMITEIESIPMSSPDITEDDIRAVSDVVRSGRLALGPKTEEFERRIAEYVGAKYAVAVNSGTSALHLMARAMGLGPGDEVLVPSFTFAASVNAPIYVGATPVFVDIEPDTYNLDPQDLEKKITPCTKAIIAVDVFGHPADWREINRIAARYDLKVIDDSCEALGAEYEGTKLGRFGDVAAFAFYPNKQITTGEGGMIVTNDCETASICRSMRNQGRGEMGAWLEHERLGYNYRMTEMSAALGITQIMRIEKILAKRQRVARMYDDQLSCLDHVSPPVIRPNVKMSWFVYVATLAEGLDRDQVIQDMMNRGIPARGYFSPMHQQSYIQKSLCTRKWTLPVTESAAKRTIALPFHGNLSLAEVEHVVDALSECARRQLS